MRRRRQTGFQEEFHIDEPSSTIGEEEFVKFVSCSIRSIYSFKISSFVPVQAGCTTGDGFWFVKASSLSRNTNDRLASVKIHR